MPSKFSLPIKIAVVTGSRAEFGLLRPVMKAILASSGTLEMSLVVTGLHLLNNKHTLDDVRREFEVTQIVEMQSQCQEDLGTQAGDVTALGNGIIGLGSAFQTINPDVVVLLGDRIEAFAAASAASIGGRLVAHIHGGDRAEGVADDAIRHAITKLSHIHYSATAQSAERIIKLGENPKWVFNVGSSALDGLAEVTPLKDEELASLGIPNPAERFAVILHHPCGLDLNTEYSVMSSILRSSELCFDEGQYIIMLPNYDDGRSAIDDAIADRPTISHLPRDQWIGLLRRASILVGNSSAGLIEASALGLPVVNIGPRQAGRERADNVFDVPIIREYQSPVSDQGNTLTQSIVNMVSAIATNQITHNSMRTHHLKILSNNHPFGNGTAGIQIANHLSQLIHSTPDIRKLMMF